MRNYWIDLTMAWEFFLILRASRRVLPKGGLLERTRSACYFMASVVERAAATLRAKKAQGG